MILKNNFFNNYLKKEEFDTRTYVLVLIAKNFNISLQKQNQQVRILFFLDYINKQIIYAKAYKIQPTSNEIPAHRVVAQLNSLVEQLDLPKATRIIVHSNNDSEFTNSKYKLFIQQQPLIVGSSDKQYDEQILSLIELFEHNFTQQLKKQTQIKSTEQINSIIQRTIRYFMNK